MPKLIILIILLVAVISGTAYIVINNQSLGSNIPSQLTAKKTTVKNYKIGIISDSSIKGSEDVIINLQDELKSSGFNPEYIRDEYKSDKLDVIAKGYVEKKVDVIVANGNVAVKAAKNATSTIPIVFGRLGDPVLDKVVTSLENHNSNITGVSSGAKDTTVRNLDYLRLINPKIKKVYVLFIPGATGDIGAETAYNEMLDKAERLGMKLIPKRAQTPEEMDKILSSLTASEGDAFIVHNAFTNIGALAQWVPKAIETQNRAKIPYVGNEKGFVEKGGILSNGPDFKISGRQAAQIIIKILNGVPTKDIPIELYKKVDFAINKKSADAIGLEITQEALTKADTIIK